MAKAGCLVSVHDAADADHAAEETAPKRRRVPRAPERSISDVFDGLNDHVHRAGLALASARNVCRDSAVAASLDQVSGQLDLLVAEIHAAAHSQAVTPSEDDSQRIPLYARRLRHIESGTAFAYLHGDGEWVRAADGAVWAYESDGVLRSARSGHAFARRRGAVFYDIETHTPLYCEEQAPGI